MQSDRLRRAEAEAEAAQLRDDLARLSEERLRLSRKNERLVYALHVLREKGLDEAMQDLVEDALGFDGLEPEPGDSFTLLGFNLVAEAEEPSAEPSDAHGSLGEPEVECHGSAGDPERQA